jgi:4-hydroxy-tetrahydrodipicolinate synthase
MKKLTGVFTALVTPFKKGQVDKESLVELVRFQLENGIQGFVVSGTTAESPTLSRDEKKQIFEIVKTEVTSSSAQPVAVVLGTGSNSTNETIQNTQDALSWGADAALVVVPYYNKPPQRGLVAHFKAVAQAVPKLPILLYNVPSRTVAGLSVESIQELSRVPNIVGIKEATGDIEFGKKLIEACGPDFLVSSGDDATYLQLLRVGGCGLISVAAHILPREFVRWSERTQKGQSGSDEEMKRFSDLISYLYVEANPIPVKMALKHLGIIQSAELRLPLSELGENESLKLKEKMKQAGLL